MADTTSIASRMEKLAKLKRMKEGMIAQSSAAPVVSTPQTEALAPIEEAAEAYATVEPNLPAEPEISMPEDFSSVKVTPEAPTDDTPDTSTDMISDVDEDTSQPVPESSDDVFDFDPANIREEDLDPEAAFSEKTAMDEETTADATPVSPEASVDFVMQGADEPSISDADSTDVTAEADDADFQAIEDQNQTSAEFSASALGIEGDEQIADMADIDGIAAAAAVSSSSRSIDEEFEKSLEDTDLPDFSANEIDEELLNREFEDEAASEPPVENLAVSESPKAPVVEENSDGRITVSFDESRSTLLDHVSRQMSCSVEDVVVTALDWYLDALFGEDDEAKSA